MKKYFFLKLFCLISVLSIGFWGCHKDDLPPVAEQDVIDQEIIEKYLLDSGLTDVTTKHESGLYFQKTIETTNIAVSAGDIVSIYFEAHAFNQQLFDKISQPDGDIPVKMRQGVNAIFPIGLDIALGLMNLGEEATFYLPASLAYGDLDELSSIIPANSVIRFKISIATIENEQEIFVRDTTNFRTMIDTYYLDSLELFPIDTARFQSEDFFYKRQSNGMANSFVSPDDTAVINFKVYKINQYPNGSPFDARDEFPFQVAANKVVQGLDLAVSKMVRDERAAFFLPSKLLYNESVFVTPRENKQYLVDNNVIPQYSAQVSPFEPLIFEIHLLNN